MRFNEFWDKLKTMPSTSLQAYPFPMHISDLNHSNEKIDHFENYDVAEESIKFISTSEISKKKFEEMWNGRKYMRPNGDPTMKIHSIDRLSSETDFEYKLFNTLLQVLQVDIIM